MADCDRVNQDDMSLLAALLADIGGGYWYDAVPWLREGLKQVERVRQGEVESSEWQCETFAVDLDKAGARIYSLYVDDYDDTLPLEDFEAALRAWVRFVEAGPTSGETNIDI